MSYSSSYNDANQRIHVTLADGSFWVYEYDSLGQVTTGKKYWPDWTPVAGQQFEYAHDDIGNRNSTKAGGDENGSNLRSATYSVNNLNQYTNRIVPGAADIIGVANAPAVVTVNTQATYRHTEYYRKELSISNSSAPQYVSVTNKAGQSGQVSVLTI
jgi:YD repeat-containing protein